MPKVTDLNLAEREIKSARLHHVKVQLMFTAIMTLTHLPRKLYDEYYEVGWADIKLPHNFKIGIGGCPNSCVLH